MKPALAPITWKEKKCGKPKRCGRSRYLRICNSWKQKASTYNLDVTARFRKGVNEVLRRKNIVYQGQTGAGVRESTCC